MRIVFMGTPAYAAVILEELSYQHDVACVYTRPDAVRGRGKSLVPSDVRACAERLGIPVRTPRTLRDAAVVDELASWGADAFVVAAYGAILPPEVLSIPRLGCLNAHASVLPRWRGAAPVERAILAGDDEVGVCVMNMEEGLDTGDWCICRTTEVAGRDAATLTAELADLGARAMLAALVQVESGNARWTAQDDGLATYASKVGKHELDLSPDDTVESAWRKSRAAGDAHPCRLVVGGKALTLLEARQLAADDPARASLGESLVGPGCVRLAAKRLVIGMSDGPLELVRVKPDGKREMAGSAFASGLQGAKQGLVSWEACDE